MNGLSIMNLNWSFSNITPQEIQTTIMVLSALGITGAITGWRIQIRDNIERLWIHLFHVKQVVQENQTLAMKTKTLEAKLAFVESSRDDFKGFVDDLSSRLDRLSEELESAKDLLKHVNDLLEEERNEVEKVEAERELALVWGRQLIRQLKTAGMEPIAEEPNFKA